MKKNYFFWLVATVGLIVDQLTKYWTLKTFPSVGDSIPLWQGVFHLTYVQNTGAAFSFFTNGAVWLRWLSLIVSLGLMAYAVFGGRMKPLEQIGFGFILAGALGNGIDRFFFGYVIDFLDFRLINFPVFNLADVWINLGMVCILYLSFITTIPNNKHKVDK
jgi:signal peptidase II